MHKSGDLSQKAVGIIASAKNTTLKLTTTALGEPKPKNSKNIFCLLLIVRTQLVSPLNARELMLHSNQNDINQPPNSATAAGD